MPYFLLKQLYFLTKLQFLISTFSQAEQLNIIFPDYDEPNGKLRVLADVSSPGSDSELELQVTNASHQHVMPQGGLSK
jgi:hypothetical protein